MTMEQTISEIEEKQETHTKSREEEYNEALGDLGLIDSDVEEQSLISFDQGKDSKLLQLQNIAREYKATLEGKTRADQSDSDKIVFKQTGKALASRNFIHITHSILYSYADQANIASNKTIDQFFIQFKDAFDKVQNMALRDSTISDRDHSGIIKLFKDKLLNIGQIITNETGNMNTLLGQSVGYQYREDNPFDRTPKGEKI